MAIDIRATVTCSLGTLISASLSDDYIQGTGLIKTKGSCEISGVITPAIGTVVTFSYTKGGVTRSVPRKLRVLSSFADPFRRTTKVELGCKLTYLQDLQEPVDWDAFDDPENASYDEDDAKIITVPIHASSVMEKCLTELGITASSNPLTNKFSIAKFDFSAGYVSILSDLLVSECYCGYLDTNEVLQIVALNTNGGTGPVLDSTKIIDLGSIGVGSLPGDAVTVNYSSLKLKAPEVDYTNEEDEEELEIELQRINWELDESVESVQEYFVDYKIEGSDTLYTKIYRGINASTTFTKYEVFSVFNPETGKQEEKELVVSRLTKNYGPSISIAAPFAKAYVENGFEFNNQDIITSQVYTIYSYSENFSVVETYEETLKTIAEQAGSLGIDLVYTYTLGTVPPVLVTMPVVVSFGLVQAEYTYQKTETIGETSKQVNSRWVLLQDTQHGQHTFASLREDLVTEEEAETVIFHAWSRGLMHEKTTVQSRRSGNLISELPSRPPAAERVGAFLAQGGSASNGWKTESTSELVLATGSESAQRRIKLQMPYAPDDTFSKPDASLNYFTSIASNAEAKATNYGRIQNRLLLGNRHGMNIQLEPERLPAAPFSPIIVEANGLSALYRVNGTSWTMSSDGILVSTDALFWGAVGGTGTFWFPVAPGITTLPTTPPIVDGEMTVTSVVPVWNETVKVQASTRLGLVATRLPYALALLTEVPALSTVLGITAARVKLLASDAGALTLSGQAAALVRRYRLNAAATSFAVSGFGAGSVRDYVIGTNAGTFVATGQPAQVLYARAPISAEAGIFTMTGEDAAWFRGIGLDAETGSFTSTGQDASFVRGYVLAGNAGSVTLSGQAAGLAYTQGQSALLLYTGNASTLSVTGAGFTPGLVLLKRRNNSGDHGWFDKARGATKYLRGSTGNAEVTSATTLTAFDSDGFTLGSSATFNTSSATYVAHCLREGGAVASNTDGNVTTSVSANTDLEWSAFTYTGVGNTTKTVGHGLSGAPDLVIIKARASGFTHWVGSPLFGTAKAYDFQSTSVSTTNAVFQGFGATTLTLDSNVMANSTTYMGWAFKAKAGVSDIALFTGGGSATYTHTLGWQPRFILMKNTTTTAGSWFVFYRASGGTGYADFIDTRSTGAEAVSTTVQITSDGFSVDVGGPGNVSGGTTQALFWAVK